MARPKILQDISALESVNTQQSTEISGLKNSLLVGRYYVPLSSLQTVASEKLTTNPMPTIWSGSGLYYYSGGYQIEGTTAATGNNTLNKAFDGNPSEGYHTTGLNTAVSEITIILPSEICVTAFNTCIPVSTALDTYFIQGSNNKTTWSTLYSSSTFDTSGILSLKKFSNTTNYRYYKISFYLENTAATLYVNELQIAEYTVPTKSNVMTLSDLKTPILANQIVMIRTPDFDITGVTKNTLNGINIDTILSPGKYYELLYNGTIFTAKEVV